MEPYRTDRSASPDGLQAGDLIALADGFAYRVLEVRLVPEVDWDERDHQIAAKAVLGWSAPPVYVQVQRDGADPASKPQHAKIRGGLRFIDLLRDHYPTCHECDQVWPCRDERIEVETRRFSAELARACAHCGKSTNGKATVSFNGLTFHLAKKYRGCKEAAAEAERVWKGDDSGQMRLT